MESDPNDFSDRYNTQLTPAEEQQYQTWAKSSGREKDTYDYDMRGAWKSGVTSDPRGHFPDTFKKPNHPTFSSESQYHGKDGFEGGSWSKGQGDSWIYNASPTNSKFHPDLNEYFKRVEPESQLILTPGGAP
jgi:hypothetical protein